MSSTIKIDRRALLHAMVRGGLALSLLPGCAEAAWSAVAAGVQAPRRVFSASESSLIAIIADAILPRSDTPGATDVGVPAWIDAVVGGYFSATQRANFLAGLTAIEDFALSRPGARLAVLQGGPLSAVIADLDAACGAKDPTPAQRGYAQLKELVIVGYFTSKPVQMDILKVVIVPGRFDPDVPIAPPGAA